MTEFATHYGYISKRQGRNIAKAVTNCLLVIVYQDPVIYNCAACYRVLSSAGRASPLQGECRGFDSLSTHHQMSFYGPVVQLVRMPACHAGGRGFESRPVRQFLNFIQQPTSSDLKPYRLTQTGFERFDKSVWNRFDHHVVCDDPQGEGWMPE